MVKTRFQPTRKKNKFIIRRGKNAKGLTKTERSQVKKIAESTISNVAEAKYMNAQIHLGDRPVRSTLGPSRVGVLAYSTSLSNTADGIQLTYGYAPNNAQIPIKELKMLRPFVPATGNAQTDNYALVGRECKPKHAECKWRFSREISEMLNVITASGYVTDIQTPPINLAQNLPIIFRMIRVNPKQSQTNILCDPKEDLFLDRFNNAIGVDSGTFDDTELLTYRTNRRRYNVLEDKFFRVQNGLTIQWQRVAAPTGSTALQPIISNTNANCEKLLTTNHQLTRTKHGSVFYDSPEATQLEAPSSGHKREFVLIHAMYAGAEAFFDGEPTANPTFPDDVKITASPLCKFTDV
ncbi:MAG: putative capsid protein [Cressdnaviricota sp.]|nr:MAG: putative capsid protein [Cressdnaviricota sp.]